MYFNYSLSIHLFTSPSPLPFPSPLQTTGLVARGEKTERASPDS